MVTTTDMEEDGAMEGVEESEGEVDDEVNRLAGKVVPQYREVVTVVEGVRHG